MPAIDGTIDKGQTAFVLRREITNNILLSHELVKGYGRTGISPICMLKIDMQKAYNSMEWPFLEQILNNFNFSRKFVQRILMR